MQLFERINIQPVPQPGCPTEVHSVSVLYSDNPPLNKTHFGLTGGLLFYVQSQDRL